MLGFLRGLSELRAGFLDHLQDLLIFHRPNEGYYPSYKRPAQKEIEGKNSSRISPFLIECNCKWQ